ncbi:MAG: RNA methyltransferase [Bacteroidia bacterium]|nr:RNA methyltransferase [Bacteroidia bacterium]NND25095.1 RNA methyltransferase [Flavobacteriaceae bacterium]MBT8279433.1 RNA methyltransferase [Bacteroidia bacterium]NNK59351.1 RNA methyltransferase [Flavobacteriaceae bacterium]NNL33374.1 RNA methyltransferase [Flavobacteriaceae bacterium]
MIDIALLEHLESYLTEKRRARFYQVLSQRTKHFTVAIEDVYQLHNTSAVIRSCDVFGIQDVHIIEERNSKRIDREIAMGSQKWVDLHRYHSAEDCLTELRAQNYQIVATTPHKDDCQLSDFDISRKSCFFFGRETEGLSDLILNEADCFLNIPMVGFTESLNISVSAAIILQELTSKLKKSDVSWQLSENEQIEKRLDWCKKTIKSIDSIIERYHSQQ